MKALTKAGERLDPLAPPLSIKEQAENLAREHLRGLGEVSHSVSDLAYSKAAKLWLDSLSKVQRRDWESKGYCYVKGQRGSKYRIRNTASINVERDGHTYCLIPRWPVPTPDMWLMQKILLEHDEERFLKIAYRNN